MNGKLNKTYLLISLQVVIFLLLLLSGLGYMPGMVYADPDNAVGTIRIPENQVVQILTLRDGSRLIGRITSISESQISFKSEIGEFNIDKTSIKEIKEVASNSIKNGKYWFENPNSSRLYFAPTGRLLKKGRAYFCDYYLFFPGIAYGLSDNITIGGGMSLFPVVDFNDQIFYFTPKIGIVAKEKSSLAIGGLIVALPKIDHERHTVGILYGVTSLGGPDASITVGLGYGFVDRHVAKKPMALIGGEKRFSRRISFVSENWIFPGVDKPLISYGLRFFGEGLSVDLALINTLGNDAAFPGVPWVDFVFNF
jgi:hypothetical protein